MCPVSALHDRRALAGSAGVARWALLAAGSELALTATLAAAGSLARDGAIEPAQALAVPSVQARPLEAADGGPGGVDLRWWSMPEHDGWPPMRAVLRVVETGDGPALDLQGWCETAPRSWGGADDDWSRLAARAARAFLAALGIQLEARDDLRPTDDHVPDGGVAGTVPSAPRAGAPGHERRPAARA